MKNILITITILLSLPTAASIKWQRNIENFTRAQYNASAQNWMIQRSEKGWIYAANNDGLLEYDGNKWTLYRNKGKMVRSINIQNDRIYIGGSSEFGYYKKDDSGKLKYYSLSQNLTAWGGEIWNVLSKDNYIYFISDMQIYRYNIVDESISKTEIPSKMNSSAIIDGKLYLGCNDTLFFLEEEELIPIPESRYAAEGKIVKILHSQNKILLVTAERGLFWLQNNAITSVRSIADKFIAENRLFSAAARNNILALGSVQGGLFVFNLDTNSTAEVFNLEKGLNNNTVLNISFDSFNNLWLALDNGISYIDMNNFSRPLFSKTSPIGAGYTTRLYKGKTYFGTNQGLYQFNANDEAFAINNIQGQIWSLAEIDNLLFCCGDNGLYVFDSNNNFYTVGITGVWEVYKPKNTENILFAGTYTGLAVLKKENGRWIFSHMIQNFYDSMRGFVEDEEENIYWFIRKNYSICRIELDKTRTTASSIKEYQIANRSIGDNIFMQVIDNRLSICMDEGIYRYDRLSDSFVSYTELESLLTKPNIYSYLSTDKYNNIWYCDKKGLNTILYKNGVYTEHVNWGLKNELMNTHNNITLIDSSTAIVATSNGFVQLNMQGKPHLPQDIPYIRKFICSKNDSILAYDSSRKGIKLSYENNSVKFEFTSSNFNLQANNLYMYKLEGLDEEWNTTSSNTKEFTNLHEGKYTFVVKVINDFEQSLSVEDRIDFKIMPPWYRSSWAVICYVCVIYLGVYLLYRKTIRKQKIIINRQKVEQEIKDKKIFELHNQNLQAELQYKSQELAGHILSSSRKNEILEKVKKGVTNIATSIDDGKQSSALKQMVTLVLTQINENLEDDSDFKAFKSNFDIVHQDFFKKLEQKYPKLTRKEKTLCAYLKMGLSSKEIASILNISARSVEVSRYRLRKKMELEQEENINIFLQNL